MIIESRVRDLGDGFTVKRILPSMHRKMVGPYIFVDHMGPTDTRINVRPHPHINLATVTYLFEGEILHRDSLGSEQPIQAGAVNLMTAGEGITHSERGSGGRTHGMQLWVALPDAHEEDAPSFVHYPASVIPDAGQDKARFKVITGTAFGVTSPVKTLSKMFYVEAQLKAGARVKLPDYAERAAYIVEGEVSGYKAGTLLIEDEVVASTDARVMLLGGEPIGERHIYWNFVSSRPERIEQAKADWQAQRFAKIPGDDTEFIPLPQR